MGHLYTVMCPEPTSAGLTRTASPMIVSFSGSDHSPLLRKELRLCQHREEGPRPVSRALGVLGLSTLSQRMTICRESVNVGARDRSGGGRKLAVPSGSEGYFGARDEDLAADPVGEDPFDVLELRVGDVALEERAPEEGLVRKRPQVRRSF